MIKLVLITFLLMSCTVSVQPERVCGFIRNSYGQNVHQRFPITFYVDDVVPENYRNDIEKAAQDWNYATGIDIFEYGGISHFGNIYHNSMSVTWISDVWTREKMEQAYNHIEWSGETIASSSIYVDAVNWTFSTNDQRENGVIDLESVMVHEFGHMIGLVHSRYAQSAMYPTLDRYTKRPINDLDIQNIYCQYRE